MTLRIQLEKTAKTAILAKTAIIQESGMTTVTALEAKNRFGKLLEMAQRGPVTITKNGRESAVIMSPETFQQFDKIDQLNRQRFIRSMAAASREAEKNGITDDIIEELLRDDS